MTELGTGKEATVGIPAVPVVALRVRAGILGGLAGGVVFGMLMQMMGMLGTIAGMLGSSSILVGWIVHLMISAVFGLIFGLAPFTWARPITWGLLYGLILWILFPFTMMPAMLGMPLPWSGAGLIENLPSMMGHLVYGLLLALVGRKLV